jgi:Cu+-exporting ATPase
MTAEPEGLTPREWALACRLAAESVHPISRAMAAAGGAGTVTSCEEIPGSGLRGVVDGRRVVIGSASFVRSECGATWAGSTEGTIVAIDGVPRGAVRLVTPARPGVTEAIRDLEGTHETWLISGDRGADSHRWQALFGDRMAFRQTPEDKLGCVDAAKSRGARVLMVGDGLNDAAALASADVGIAVSDDTACIVPACDAVIRGDRVETLPSLLRFARRARQLVIACFVISILYNAAGLSLALAGRLTPLATAVLMPISSLTILALGAGGMRWFARRLPPPMESRA